MIQDKPNRTWIYVIPTSPEISFPNYQGRRITREEYIEHWGKWVITGDKEQLDEWAQDLDMAVEEGLIYMIKYLRSVPQIIDMDTPLMCVYCDDRERGEILYLLSVVGIMPHGWEYEREMYEQWEPGGVLLERWIELQNYTPKEAEEARQDCSRERKTWLEYFFVTNERVGRVRQNRPISSPEDMDKLPAEKDLRLMTPIVAIVGMLNVGKSTLFNQLIGEKKAIVANSPGTTHDRIHADVSWDKSNLTLMDTRGLELADRSGLSRESGQQLDSVIQDSDFIIFVVDGQKKMTYSERKIAQAIKDSDKPSILAINKVDQGRLRGDEELPFWQLGFSEPLFISARNNKGLTEIKNELILRFPTTLSHFDKSSILKLAIVGSPNVGKSTLLNGLVGYERAVVEQTGGTTQDSTDTVWYYMDNDPVLLIDTASIHSESEITGDIDRQSTQQALNAIERSDIVLFILDALELASPQDIHIAGCIEDASKPSLILVNKWDLAKDQSQEAMENLDQEIRSQFKFLTKPPILFISAEFKHNIDQIVPNAREILAKKRMRVSSSLLNDKLKRIMSDHPPPPLKEKDLDIYYLVQGEVDPPSFVFFVNDRTLVPPSYKRFLENEFHESFGFEGVPFCLIFKDIV